jgi:hypothetical protein
MMGIEIWKDMSDLRFSRVHWLNPRVLVLRCPLSDILWPFHCLALDHPSYISYLSMAGEVIPPPFVIGANDKRGLIVVTGAAVLAFVWSCFLIRVWLRLQSREWRSDGECSVSYSM